VDLRALADEAGADAVTGDDSVIVIGERPTLERALGNLVRNARKHGTGRVTIGVERHGDRARLSVADEGPGPADPDRVFDRFWRGPDGGSGLGLAIVKAIAERHGGSATVKGARFVIELPASHDSLKPRP
jgi:two-component system OmpR family sensor kinase